jgi:prepilin-type N-terminal cleavage/methylation domain-containing protein
VTRREDGFTMVELLVAVALTSLIVPVLTSALVVGWRTTDDTLAQLADTRNRQLVPSLLTRDVQSATSVSKTVTASSCILPTDTLLVQLTIVQPTSASAVSQSIGWVLTPTQLVARRTCASGSSTVLSSVSAAHDVSSATVYCRASNASARTSTCPAASPIVDLVVVDRTGTFTATGTRRST